MLCLTRIQKFPKHSTGHVIQLIRSSDQRLKRIGANFDALAQANQIVASMDLMEPRSLGWSIEVVQAFGFEIFCPIFPFLRPFA